MGEPFDFISEEGWPYPDGDDDAPPEPVDLWAQVDDDLVALHAMYSLHGHTGLTETERRVISAHFGLDGLEPRTLRQLHDELGYSPRHLRRTLHVGLLKLRGALADDPVPRPDQEHHRLV